MLVHTASFTPSAWNFSSSGKRPLERAAPDRDVAAVIVEIARQQPFVLGRGHRLGRRADRALDHVPGAMADERAQRLSVDPRQTEMVEHVVGRGDEVRRRVDERAVEIED